MKKTPDYSRYSLEELRELAGRTGKQLFSRQYTRLMREIEKRERESSGADAAPAAPGCGRVLLHCCGGMVLAHFALVVVPRAIFPASFSLPFALSPYGLWAAQFIIGVVIGCCVPEPRQGAAPYTMRRLLNECLALLLGFLGGAGLGWMGATAVGMVVLLSRSTADVAEIAAIESFWNTMAYLCAAAGGVGGGVFSQKAEGRTANVER